MGNCPEVKIPGGNFIGSSCLGGSVPEGNYSEVIVQGVFVLEEI